LVPIGVGSSIGDKGRVLGIVDAERVAYKVTPMGTVIEGEWDEVMKLLKNVTTTIMLTEERVVNLQTIDDRPGKLEQELTKGIILLNGGWKITKKIITSFEVGSQKQIQLYMQLKY